MSVTPAQRLARIRLASQWLVGSRATSPADVVRSMMAMQAQDFAGAKWAVGLRLPASTEAQVDRALADGTIVRSWPMRGTLHFVAPEDLGWILALTTDRLVAGSAGRRAELGLDERQLETARTAAQEALAGGHALTRGQMHELFVRAGVSVESQRGYQILWYLAQTGTLCFGPPQPKQQTFVLLDEWVGQPRRLERDEALGELAERYFSSHGPSTIKDFAWWSSLRMKDARTGLAVARPRLAEMDSEESTYYLSPEAEEATTPATRALPAFDEFLLGYQDRSAQVPAEHAGKVMPPGGGTFLPTIAADGIVMGTWKRMTTARGIRVETAPFQSLNRRVEAGFARAAADYAAFLGVPLLA
jgi:hypothetical protein